MAVRPSSPLELRAASLFDVDPELSEILDARQRAEARGHAVVAVLDLAAGPWSPAGLRKLSTHPFALLVVEGMLVRELLVAGSTATELLGPCDIVDHEPSEDALLPSEALWSVPHSARVAILDDRLLGILRAWPRVGRLLLDRTTRREARLLTHRAITQLPRVDQRLLAFFMHVAERWGRVAATGVVIPLQLTHETLGRLIGARRPTVSLALKDLGADGLLERRADGSWLLHYEAFERLGAEAAIPPGWQPADARQIEHSEIDVTGGRRPAVPGVSADDLMALRERVTRLKEQHAVSMSRAEAILERVRESRRERDGQGAAAGPPARPG